MSDEASHDTRCGIVGIIGAPNTGKSTLINSLVGSKVSIVTHKVQTTRAQIRAIVMDDNTQMIFVDTPGIFPPRRRLDRAMVQAAWSCVEDADIIALMVDASKSPDDGVNSILESLSDMEASNLLILNKIDLIKKEALLKLAQSLNSRSTFAATFMISALKGSGTAALREYLLAAMPRGPWLYPEDKVSDIPLRVLAAEITREKLYLRLHQELPYASTVETAEWKRLRSGTVRIEQTIFVERESQRQIVLGKNGRTIKQIGIEARRDLANIIEADIQLFLFVKVREHWGDDPERFRQLGLDFPD